MPVNVMIYPDKSLEGYYVDNIDHDWDALDDKKREQNLRYATITLSTDRFMQHKIKAWIYESQYDILWKCHISHIRVRIGFD